MRLRAFNDFDPTLCTVDDGTPEDVGGGGGDTGGAAPEGGEAAPVGGEEAAPEGGEAPAAEGGEEAPSWSGEIDGLTEAEWFSTLDPAVQESLKEGYSTKLKNYDKGYQAKFRELAEQRKAWETGKQADLAKIQQERKDFEALLYGDGDPMTTLKAQYERDQAAAQERIAALEGQLQEQATKQNEQAADAIHNFIEQNAQDIYTDDEAFGMVVDLLAAGIDHTKALKMVRATMTEAEEPSKAVQAMSSDSNPTATNEVKTMDWREAAKEEMRRLQSS